MKIEIIDSDFIPSTEFESVLIENEGSFKNNCQSALMKINGTEVLISFSIDLKGRIDIDRGDYDTPPFTEISNLTEKVEILSVEIDGSQIDIDNNQNKIYLNLIQKAIHG